MAHHSNGYSGDDRDHGLDRDDRSNDGGDKPTYLMEHLATFTGTKETGIVYPADGMRRLLQLEKSNGIWSQKMHLCFDRSWVLIMDDETGIVVERFPANSIQEPTAFTSHDPMEMYNNILVFSVTNSNTSYPPEMHIFQCQSISAQDLVEDLKQLRSGKPITRNRKSSIPPPPSHKASQQAPIIIPRDNTFNAFNRESDSELTGNNDDDTSSTSSEKYERDVTILNHCFDDIEKFIARLQHAAAASRELERRRRSRKNKKRDMGDGMLTMRTKPPPEKEFFDIFQKFKLSFNLLAKLKAHIHDPNAPELVHFLFTPLALIVEASHETYYDLNLPPKVISPLLTREAANLLMNCVTSKETELWHSLGNAWLVPRDQWKGPVPSYHPVFYDGWSPEYPVVDEEYYDYDGAPDQSYMYDSRNADPHDAREHKMDPNERELLSTNVRDLSTRSDISVDSIERNGGADDRNFSRGQQEAWLEDLQARGATIVQVTYPRTANNDKELTVVRGEFLEVLDDTRKWWKARNSRGQVAHVPHTIVTQHHIGNEPNDIFNNPLYMQNSKIRQESHQFDGGHPYMSGQSPSGGDHASYSPSVPVVPADLVRKERLDTENKPPPPPPPPPAPPQATPSTFARKRAQSISGTSINGDRMQEELLYVLEMFKEKRERRNYDVTVTPEVYISQKSSPNEVQQWLKDKCFSPAICKGLTGYNGNEILSLNRSQLEKCCGPTEGKRLASQLAIQKTVCGYQTVRSTELKQILAKARQKVESHRPMDY